MENNDKQIEFKFQRFFTVNFPKVKNFAQMLLKSESDAEDVAQDVFMNLFLSFWALYTKYNYYIHTT